ncbi:hypothetical protein RUM44_004893 [Polyplax serrata]|uniref:Kinesin-like protein n=1 Tax=Polyplax serrata TaxID=468196 RepID=A0ABR1B443_POLSC
MSSTKKRGTAKSASLVNRDEAVQVVVRCRPMSTKEKETGCTQVVHVFPHSGEIEVVCPNENVMNNPVDQRKIFTFDAVYDSKAKQQDLYDEAVRPLVVSVLQGFNATVFAYGQTGTGKTYTMEGIKKDNTLKGIIPRSFDQIFMHIENTENMQYLVRVSYMEIYQEKIRDLLEDPKHPKRHEIRETPDGEIYVEDLMLINCKDVSQIEKVMYMGNINRTVGATEMNEHSSRSHAIFQIRIEMSETNTEAKYSNIKLGMLNLVDLAGSERQNKTGSTGERLKEASKINLSLSALGNVISALVNGSGSHIPYRDSKLTRLLQDSLGGNSRTLMIANIDPASYNLEETLTTLRYAHRAKSIKNKPRVNEDPKDTLMRKLKDEIAHLQEALAKKNQEQELRKKKKGAKKKSKVQEIINEKSYDKSESIKEGALEDVCDELLNDDELVKQNHEANALMEKIQSLENKMVLGGKNIVDHTNEQQRALEKSLAEIAEKKRKEIEMRRKLEQEDESYEIVMGNYQSLQQEVDLKTKKLRRLFSKLQYIKQDIIDNTEVFNKERRDLEDTQSALIKDLKLKRLIIDNFMPVEQFNKVLASMRYDEYEDTWKAGRLETSHVLSRRPVAVVGERRPTSEYARVAYQLSSTPRYRSENVLDLDLDMPERTTMDYEGPVVAPKILAMLDEALQVEDNIDIDASRVKAYPGRYSARPRNVTTASAKSKRQGLTSAAPVFPKARGLVPK